MKAQPQLRQERSYWGWNPVREHGMTVWTAVIIRLLAAGGKETRRSARPNALASVGNDTRHRRPFRGTGRRILLVFCEAAKGVHPPLE
jgi:hypothetical protein